MTDDEAYHEPAALLAEIRRLREALEEAYQFLIDLPVRGPKLERARVLGIKIRTALAKEAGE